SSRLAERQKLAITFADTFLSAQGPPSADVQTRIEEEFNPAELAELGIGLALFHGFSKMLIISGCEPEEMETTVLAAPGSQPR
ncbi:MAG: hypothetical protein ACKOA5_14155, partial [Actinomycetota bacterium]